MRPVAMISLVIFFSIVAIPVVLSFGSNDFYLYQDTNSDGTFDNRIHFRGDLQAELSKYKSKSSIDTCWRHVELWIYSVDCGNQPPCSPGYSCDWTGSTWIAFYFSTAPCSCITVQSEQTGDSHIYMKTNKDNIYSQIPVGGREFNKMLFNQYQVVKEDKNLQRCDASFTVHYSLVCQSTWYCPSNTCQRNPNAYITSIIALEPLCECHYLGPPPGNTLSKEGVICLLVLLIVATAFIMLRRQKMKTI